MECSRWSVPDLARRTQRLGAGCLLLAEFSATSNRLVGQDSEAVGLSQAEVGQQPGPPQQGKLVSVNTATIFSLPIILQGVWSVDFKPVSNSNLLCSASEDGTVCMWDARSNKLARRFEGGHTAPVYCVRWSPDGSMIATGSEDAKVCQRNTANEHLLH